jgi:hypothetical protein
MHQPPTFNLIDYPSASVLFFIFPMTTPFQILYSNFIRDGDRIKNHRRKYMRGQKSVQNIVRSPPHHSRRNRWTTRHQDQNRVRLSPHSLRDSLQEISPGLGEKTQWKYRRQHNQLNSKGEFREERSEWENILAGEVREEHRDGVGRE